MHQYQSNIPSQYGHLFENQTEHSLADFLIDYLLYDKKPKTSPALWQDAEIYIRYSKRDVYSLEDYHINNAREAIQIYQVKYIINHLDKSTLLKLLNNFFNQKSDDPKSLPYLLEQKLHLTFDTLFLSQEQLIINESMLQHFDQIFEYPAWIEFTDEANQAVFDQILEDKLTDEQIDYFLGASDNIRDYDQWFKIVKHILTTTQNFHVLWTAGDILSIIRKAIPSDSKSQKWFNDQIFEIFWPRIGSIWPLQNADCINFEQDDNTRILKDSIGWLRTLPDLTEHLPDLDKDFETIEPFTDKNDFSHTAGLILGLLNSNDLDFDKLMNLFFELTEYVYDTKSLSELEEIASKITAYARKNKDYINTHKVANSVERAIQHSKDYLANLAQESKNLATRLIKA